MNRCKTRLAKIVQKCDAPGPAAFLGYACETPNVTLFKGEQKSVYACVPSEET